MNGILDYMFVEPPPWTWLVQDILALGLGLFALAFLLRREKRPFVAILEAFAFMFLYAAVYENAAIVMGLYSYGRSLVMVGYVPFSVPLIEALVLITGFWFLEKTTVPKWAWPPIIGLFGMLQDFSLDPLAIRQFYSTGEGVTARWNWLIGPTDVNILNIPVFNFPGWMLIMLYGSACLLIGRWWYKKSGYKTIVGIVYPFLTMFVALLLMISPLSRLLLWLGPVFQKGDASEWFLLAFHLLVPTLLLILLWRGKNTSPFTRNDMPIFVVPTVLHLSDIAFTIIGGFTEILWIVLLASLVQTALLLFAYLNNRRLIADKITQ